MNYKTTHSDGIRLRKLDLITSIVADYFGLDKAEFFHKNRTLQIREPRQIAMYFCRKETPFALATIGGFFGKDHATILHAYNRIVGFTETDKLFKETISKIAMIIDDCIDVKIEEVKENNIKKHSFYLPHGKSIIMLGFTNLEVETFKIFNNLN